MLSFPIEGMIKTPFFCFRCLCLLSNKIEKGGASKEKLHPSITCTDGAGGGSGPSSPLPFVNKTHPRVKSDILAIKMIRLLFALPIDSREFVFLRKARERWGGLAGCH